MRTFLATFFLIPGLAAATDDTSPLLEEVVVYGRSSQLLGIASSASEGVVGYDDISLPPLLRTGELAEAVPGVVATQHSGTGKANQFFLRGFNLDHGTDFAASVDGVPINMRTHGHGQGYLDLNFLIPELVANTRYRKGPYSAQVGDFSSAGSVDFELYGRLPESALTFARGENGYYRGLLASTADLNAAALTLALDITGYDGPWLLEENLAQNKLYAAYASDNGVLKSRYSLQYYDSQWDSTDQIPARSVSGGAINRLGFIDPDLGGQTRRIALSGQWQANSWSASAYALDYDFTLFSNFTYFLENPDRGDEFEQRDSRQIYGGNFDQVFVYALAGRPLTLGWGLEARLDDINEVGLYRTQARQRFDTVRSDDVAESSLAAYAEVDWSITERLRANLGLRADYLRWTVNSVLPVNSGRGSDTQLSPKLSLAYRLNDRLEGYANFGRGMHSNDVRGTTIELDPASGEPVSAVSALVPSSGAELGFRYEQGPDFNAAVAAFWVELDSELVFVGDAGGTEPNAASRRRGVELSAFWRASSWLALNAAYTYADSNFIGVPEAEREIPGAIKQTFTLGANSVWGNGWRASLRLRHLGEAPLIEDGSVMADSSTLVNAGIAYRRGPMEWRLDLFNLLNSDDTDVVYFYQSRLPGELTAGVADRHFHPLEPRTYRASVTWHW